MSDLTTEPKCEYTIDGDKIEFEEIVSPDLNDPDVLKRLSAGVIADRPKRSEEDLKKPVTGAELVAAQRFESRFMDLVLDDAALP